MAFFSDQINNMIKLHSSKQMESYGLTKYAILKEYDPENCICKVAWYNANTDDYDSLISGWLPIVVPFIGRGDDTQGDSGDPWGLVCPPNIGQPVIVISQHGDFNNGLVLGGTYSSISPVPTVDGEYPQNGEFLIMHKTGSYLKFFNNGDVTLHTDHDLIFKVGHDWNVTVENDTIFNLKGNFTRTVGGNESATVKGDQTLNLSGNRNDSIGGSDNLHVNGTITVAADGTITFNSASVFTVNAPEIDLN
jgi:hypothetical protein